MVIERRAKSSWSSPLGITFSYTLNLPTQTKSCHGGNFLPGHKLFRWFFRWTGNRNMNRKEFSVKGRISLPLQNLVFRQQNLLKCSPASAEHNEWAGKIMTWWVFPVKRRISLALRNVINGRQHRWECRNSLPLHIRWKGSWCDEKAGFESYVAPVDKKLCRFADTGFDVRRHDARVHCDVQVRNSPRACTFSHMSHFCAVLLSQVRCHFTALQHENLDRLLDQDDDFVSHYCVISFTFLTRWAPGCTRA